VIARQADYLTRTCLLNKSAAMGRPQQSGGRLTEHLFQSCLRVRVGLPLHIAVERFTTEARFDDD
jgi:hypothetical protein